MVLVKSKAAQTSNLMLSRFLTQAQRLAGVGGKVNVVITDDRELRALNRRYRRKDKPTDVLSFSSLPQFGKELAGDIAISAQYAGRSARRFGHTASEELKILILHGLLHLAGYDHERDNGTMGRREEDLRRRLGLPVSLIARSSPTNTRRRKKEKSA